MKYTANFVFMYLLGSVFASVGKPQYLAVDCRGTFGVSNPAYGLEGARCQATQREERTLGNVLNRFNTLIPYYHITQKFLHNVKQINFSQKRVIP